MSPGKSLKRSICDIQKNFVHRSVLKVIANGLKLPLHCSTMMKSYHPPSWWNVYDDVETTVETHIINAVQSGDIKQIIRYGNL